MIIHINLSKMKTKYFSQTVYKETTVTVWENSEIHVPSVFGADTRGQIMLSFNSFVKNMIFA